MSTRAKKKIAAKKTPGAANLANGAANAPLPPVKKMNAAQKIAAMESVLLSHEKQFGILADEIDRMRGLVESLAKRLNASIKATDSDDSVKQIIFEENAKELKGKVDFLEKQGVLVRNNKAMIGEKTFVVGTEHDDEGVETNPRLQFAVGSLDEKLKISMLGHRLGDESKSKEKVADGGFFIKITEVYDIVDPKIEKKFEEEEAPDKIEKKVEEPKAAGSETKTQ